MRYHYSHHKQEDVTVLKTYICQQLEKLWSKVKAILRKLRVRSLDALDTAIRFALNCAAADDCPGWFHCAGYCLF